MGFLTALFGCKQFDPVKIAKQIISVSFAGADKYLKETGDSRDTLHHVANEYIYFHLHYLCRVAFDKDRIKGQESYYDPVVYAVIFELTSITNQSFIYQYATEIADSEKFYSQIKPSDIPKEVTARVCKLSDDKYNYEFVAVNTEVFVPAVTGLKVIVCGAVIALGDNPATLFDNVTEVNF